ncbi:hypothetical protein EJ02DRAFT_505155 [Clathrospora elynae]|uniref:Uncharacterized protein n=1 Tax=Clathrospora elynae TaxID=706981 RepID=A0A6A5SH45_9PLEO|nr:hypothetical protein EJ02DRAFT_505155 [Clathrospora elynae]
MAVARLQAILACLACSEAGPHVTTYPNEKAALLSAHDPAAAIADDVLASIVGAYGWKENIAKLILKKLTAALQCADDAREKLGPVVNDAYHKAWEAAKSTKGFVIEHPVMCTVIALGVLCLVAPFVLPTLGFAELGPVGGTFASWWQSTYGELVPQGSLFSFFQRLGMKWRPILV